ncbi:MAG: 16S rRNA (uracil(1498)-N(3))-methyltransferase [Aerococcaceae bacterium]|nr:16S rRNA (uracil(1498)-N(3))-methyltransferase [Aerococcaceae bacterium]
MQRYFVSEYAPTIELSKEDSHHLLNVMRAKIGTQVIVVAGNQPYLATLVDTQTAILALTEPFAQESELPVQVTIACGLSKNDKIETIVQKATECGMNAFIPVVMQRDVVKWDAKKATQRTERLAKIAKEAAEQSHRVAVPHIHDLHAFKQLLSAAQDYDVKLVAYEETAKQGRHSTFKESILQLKHGQRVLMVFGSEGGLTATEVEQLEQHGFQCCSLGPRILRAETAPIYALSALSYALEL